MNLLSYMWWQVGTKTRRIVSNETSTSSTLNISQVNVIDNTINLHSRDERQSAVWRELGTVDTRLLQF